MELANVHEIFRVHQLEDLDDIRVVELDAAAAGRGVRCVPRDWCRGCKCSGYRNRNWVWVQPRF